MSAVANHVVQPFPGVCAERQTCITLWPEHSDWCWRKRFRRSRSPCPSFEKLPFSCLRAKCRWPSKHRHGAVQRQRAVQWTARAKDGMLCS